MKTFLDFDTAAAARGEGLHPELRLLLERAAMSPFSDITKRHGMLQSGPDPVPQELLERANISPFPQASTPRNDAPNPNPEVLARLFRKHTT
jgi:hypothetical protein